ncbi:MAG TPA: AbrB/MazE/SpoVT family DNA-binding domain-containing protein [Thermoplasmata archaeon]|nr:AbrB/MazE/SpoVT family DNA-binding domain-containing protein [Thermoplasmata archaeon]
MGVSKLTRNFQVTVPRDVRDLKRLKEGDQVIFAIDGERVELHKADEDVIAAAAGIWTRTREGGVRYERSSRRKWAIRQKRVR